MPVLTDFIEPHLHSLYFAGGAAQGDWPKKPVLQSFDVVEKGGFVWLFYGSKMMPMDARPPIPFVPEVHPPRPRPTRPPQHGQSFSDWRLSCGKPRNGKP